MALAHPTLHEGGQRLTVCNASQSVSPAFAAYARRSTDASLTPAGRLGRSNGARNGADLPQQHKSAHSAMVEDMLQNGELEEAVLDDDDLC